MYRFIDLSIYRYIDISIYRFIDIPKKRFIDISIYRYIDLSLYRYIDLPIYRFIAISIYRYIDIFVYHLFIIYLLFINYPFCIKYLSIMYMIFDVCVPCGSDFVSGIFQPTSSLGALGPPSAATVPSIPKMPVVGRCA